MCLWKRRQLEKVLLDSSGFSGLIYLRVVDKTKIYLRVLFFCYFPIVHFTFVFSFHKKSLVTFFLKKSLVTYKKRIGLLITKKAWPAEISFSFNKNKIKGITCGIEKICSQNLINHRDRKSQ